MKSLDLLKNNNHARLIPSFKRPERKLLSTFMAILNCSPNFRGKFLKNFGFNSEKASQINSFMEPEFEHPNIPPGRPDGLICCKRGNTHWSAFIEAKVNGNEVRSEQIQKYLDLAKFLEVPVVISISNEFNLSLDQLPYNIPSNKYRGREVYHCSWSYIENQMSMFCDDDDVPEVEAIIIKEALLYFNDPLSGVSTFDQMPAAWPDFVTSSATKIGFNNQTAGLADIIHGWHQERRDITLKLGKIIREPVKQLMPRKLLVCENERVKFDRAKLADHYVLEGAFTLGKSKVTLEVTAYLQSCTFETKLKLLPPADKQAKACASWLCKKINVENSPVDQIEFEWSGNTKSINLPVDSFLKHPHEIICDNKLAPKLIYLKTEKQDVRRFKSRKRFIEDLENQLMKMAEFSKQIGLLES